MATDVIVKKWGNSMGIILPKELVEERNLKEGDRISIEVIKWVDLSDVFGSMKDRKMTGQEFKDMVRKGWEKER